jgi:enoyl-CoA hydratase/carnithine racemase
MTTVLYDTAEAVATITLNRPDRLNAFTLEMAAAYTEALLRADADPAVRVVVVTGAGRGFCAGADLDLLGSSQLNDTAPQEGPRPEVAARIRKPVIAAVNGPAAGLGFVAMLHADVRFVAADAKLTLSFARLGLVAEYGSAWLLSRLVGLATATDLLLSSRTITGTEAVALGLAKEALPAAEVLPAAREYALLLARMCSPRSLAVIKSQLSADQERSLPQALAEAETLMRASFAAPDITEGLAAHAERRPPNFPPLT